MKYLIKHSAAGTKLVTDTGKTIISAPFISEYAPGTDSSMIIARNASGEYSLFSTKQGKMIVEKATIADPILVDKDVPLLFRDGQKTVYINPLEEKRHILHKDEAICFAQQIGGKPSHELVFKVSQGVPEILSDQRAYETSATDIIRHCNNATIQTKNAYLPLLLTTPDGVVNFLGSTKATDYRAYATAYAELEGKERVPGYLQTISNKLTQTLSENGEYAPDRIKSLAEMTQTETRQLSKKIKELRATIDNKTELIAAINEELGKRGYEQNLTSKQIKQFFPDKKKTKKKLKTLNTKIPAPSKKQPPQEIKDMYLQKQQLADELETLQTTELAPACVQEESAEAKQSKVEVVLQSYKQIDKVSTLFETIAQENGTPITIEPVLPQDKVELENKTQLEKKGLKPAEILQENNSSNEYLQDK